MHRGRIRRPAWVREMQSATVSDIANTCARKAFRSGVRRRDEMRCGGEYEFRSSCGNRNSRSASRIRILLIVLCISYNNGTPDRIFAGAGLDVRGKLQRGRSGALTARGMAAAQRWVRRGEAPRSPSTRASRRAYAGTGRPNRTRRGRGGKDSAFRSRRGGWSARSTPRGRRLGTRACAVGSSQRGGGDTGEAHGAGSRTLRDGVPRG